MTTDSSVIHKYLSGRLTERTWDVSLATSAPITRWTLADRKGRGVGTNRRTPRVKAFCVGQAKSGTASIVGLLSANYRAAHEPERAATLDLILRHAHGELSATGIREHLHERDARLDLEYDVAWANQFLIPHLLAVFPAAKFIVLMRDCYTWLQADLDRAQVYSEEEIDEFVRRYLGGAERDRLDPILDACVAAYVRDLDEDGQVEFKGNAKAFIRTYGFLSSVLPYSNAAWEKRSIFLNFLVSKLPAPKEEDLSKGILDAIDLDSYRVEKQAMQKIPLPDEDAEIGPVPTSAGGHRPESELDRISNILRNFNEHWGTEWDDEDRVEQLISQNIPVRVAADTALRNARLNLARKNARIEHDKALLCVMTSVMTDDAKLFKKFMGEPDFRRWMTDVVFTLAYGPTIAPSVRTRGRKGTK